MRSIHQTPTKDRFHATYTQKCTEIGIEPLASVIDTLTAKKQLAADNNLPQSKVETLNLSGFSIPLKLCTALANALAADTTFTRVILADAFLGDDGYWNGNSIRVDGAVALGQMLKVNNTLQHLNLEWNCIGIWESGIAAIADALSMNCTLQSLDLRNNKIGPKGASVLALSLKHNTSYVSV